MKNKKSAVDLTDLAIGIVVLGVVVSIGAVILLSVRDNRLTNLDTFTQTNQTVTASDGNPQIVLPADSWGATFTAVETNASNAGQAVPATNYTATVDATNGAINLDFDGAIFNGTSVNITYTAYNTSRADWNLPNQAATGLAEYGNWFDIIVIVGIAGLILTLIFMAFGRAKGSDVGGTY